MGGGNPNKKHASIKLGLALAALAFFNLAALCDNPVSSGDKQENQKEDPSGNVNLPDGSAGGSNSPPPAPTDYERLSGYYVTNPISSVYQYKSDGTGLYGGCALQGASSLGLRNFTYTISNNSITDGLSNGTWDENNETILRAPNGTVLIYYKKVDESNAANFVTVKGVKWVPCP